MFSPEAEAASYIRQIIWFDAHALTAAASGTPKQSEVLSHPSPTTQGSRHRYPPSQRWRNYGSEGLHKPSICPRSPKGYGTGTTHFLVSYLVTLIIIDFWKYHQIQTSNSEKSGNTGIDYPKLHQLFFLPRKFYFPLVTLHQRILNK